MRRSARLRGLAPAALFALSLAAPAWSAVTETSGIGDRASALGGAVSATTSDPAALYYNPAGLTAIRQAVVWLDFASFTGAGESKSPESGEHSDFSLDAFVVRPTPLLAGPLPWDGTTWAFGIVGTAGLASRFPEDFGESRFSAYSAKVLETVLTPAVAWQVTPEFSLGVTLEVTAFTKFTNIARAGDGYVGDLVSAMSGQSVSTRDGRDDADFRVGSDKDFPSGLRPNNELALAFDNASFIVGAQYQAHPRLRIGLVYRERSEPTIPGTVDVFLDESARATTGLPDPSTAFETEVLTRPRQVVAGLSLEGPAGWHLHLDGQWSQWSEARNLRLEFSGDGLFGQRDLVIPLEMHDTFSPRIGIEKVFDSGKRFWVGYWHDKDPVPDRTYFAAFFPGDVQMFSLGGFFPDLLGAGTDVGVYAQYGPTTKRRLDRGESKNAGGLKTVALDSQGRLAFGANDAPLRYKNASLTVVGFTIHHRFDTPAGG